MNTQQQIFIDEYVVRPVVSILNLFVILLGKLLHIDHSLSRPSIKTIAVCKYKGMGSIIQATPLLQSLRQHYPQAKIIFVSTPANQYIVNKTALVDEFIAFNDKGIAQMIWHFPAFIWRLMRAKIDIYIDLEVYSNFSTLVTILSVATNRLGLYLQSKHYRLGNYTHMMYHNTQVPIREAYMQFARLCGYRGDTPPLVELHSTIEQVPLQGQPFRLKAEKYIVINPNASDLRLERRWGRSNYRQLIQELADSIPSSYKLVLIGAPNETDYVQKVVEGLARPTLINMAGQSTQEELIALIQNAQLMITNDSGPMHIAFATKTPSVNLFGPCSPMQYGNMAQRGVSIYKQAYCSPCVHDFVNPPCQGNNRCMQLISVKEVLHAAQSILKNKKLAPQAPTITYTDKERVLGFLARKGKV